MKKIYIAGKVTGLCPEVTAAKFATAEAEVKAAGFEAINPLKVVGTWDISWTDAMRLCIAALTKADAVYLLPDHLESDGVEKEKQVADWLGMIYTQDLSSLKFIYNTNN